MLVVSLNPLVLAPAPAAQQGRREEPGQVFSQNVFPYFQAEVASHSQRQKLSTITVGIRVLLGRVFGRKRASVVTPLTAPSRHLQRVQFSASSSFRSDISEMLRNVGHFLSPKTRILF